MKLLDKFNRTFTEQEVAQAVANSKQNSAKLANEDFYKFAFNTIDITSLNSSDTENSIEKFVKKVNDLQKDFPDIPSVAAICVYPNFVKTVSDTLNLNGVNIASVAGSFPSSQTFLDIKTREAQICVEKGADEIDMVISVGCALEQNFEQVSNEIKAMKKAIGNAHLKVILETGLLLDYNIIYKASIVAMEAGADFIKTSTGKEKIGSTPEAVYVMSCAISDYHKETKQKVGLKPAGGISTPEIALHYICIVQEVLGNEWLADNKLFRIGASSLANKLLSVIYDKDVKYF